VCIEMKDAIVRLLGLAGGLTAILMGIAAFALSLISAAAGHGSAGGLLMVPQIAGGLLFMLLGLISIAAALQTRRNPKLSSSLLLLCGLAGFFIGYDSMWFLFGGWKSWIVPGTLLLTGGSAARLGSGKMKSSLPLINSDSRPLVLIGHAFYGLILISLIVLVMAAQIQLPDLGASTKSDLYEAEVAQTMGRIDKAAEAYDRLTERDPTDSRYWVLKGDALYELGKDNASRYNESLYCYEKAIELNGSDLRAWSGKKAALEALGGQNQKKMQ